MPGGLRAQAKLLLSCQAIPGSGFEPPPACGQARDVRHGYPQPVAGRTRETDARNARQPTMACMRSDRGPCGRSARHADAARVFLKAISLAASRYARAPLEP